MSKKMLLLSVGVLAVLAVTLFISSRPTDQEHAGMTLEQYRASVQEVDAAYPRLQAGELEPGQIKALKQVCENIAAYDKANEDNPEGYIPAMFTSCEEIMAAPLTNS